MRRLFTRQPPKKRKIRFSSGCNYERPHQGKEECRRRRERMMTGEYAPGARPKHFSAAFESIRARK